MEQTTKLENIAPAIQEPFIVNGNKFAEAQVFRVLIIEDEPLVALQVENELEAIGHKVIGLAASVSRALSLVENSDFDVAFLDIRLGDTSSIKVAERLSNLAFHSYLVRALRITAYSRLICAIFQDSPSPMRLSAYPVF